MTDLVRGADFHMMQAFVEAVAKRVGQSEHADKKQKRSEALSGGAESLASHLICFRAERARKEGVVVSMV